MASEPVSKQCNVLKNKIKMRIYTNTGLDLNIGLIKREKEQENKTRVGRQTERKKERKVKQCLVATLLSTVSQTVPPEHFVTVSGAQELCECRGGRPWLPSLISLRFLWT